MKIKSIIKKPNQKYQITEIEDGLKSLQNIVEGYIEAPYIPGLTENGITTWVNEEGKLLNLKPSIALVSEGKIVDIVCGTALFTSSDEEGNTTGLNNEQIKMIEKYLGHPQKAIIVHDDEPILLDIITLS